MDIFHLLPVPTVFHLGCGLCPIFLMRYSSSSSVMKSGMLSTGVSRETRGGNSLLLVGSRGNVINLKLGECCGGGGGGGHREGI